MELESKYSYLDKENKYFYNNKPGMLFFDFIDELSIHTWMQRDIP